jgi:toxin ParE1/3/4
VARIIWTDEAVEDLAAHRRYVARYSPDFAARTIERILSAIDQLEQFPSSGRVVPDVDRPDVRRLVAGRYLVIYVLRREEARIVMVHHAARRFDIESLRDRLETIVPPTLTEEED